MLDDRRDITLSTIFTPEHNSMLPLAHKEGFLNSSNGSIEQRNGNITPSPPLLEGENIEEGEECIGNESNL